MVIEWLSLMRDRESAARDSRRFQMPPGVTKLREGGACTEHVDYRAARAVPKSPEWHPDHKIPQNPDRRTMRGPEFLAGLRPVLAGMWP